MTDRISEKAKKLGVANAFKKIREGKSISAREQKLIEEYELNQQDADAKSSGDWTISRFSSEVGINYETLKKRLQQEGMFTGRGARFKLKDLIVAYFGDLEKEKILKTRAEREIAELDLAKKRSEVLDTAELKAVLDKWLANASLAIRQLKDKEESAKLLQILRSPLK